MVVQGDEEPSHRVFVHTIALQPFGWLFDEVHDNRLRRIRSALIDSLVRHSR